MRYTGCGQSNQLGMVKTMMIEKVRSEASTEHRMMCYEERSTIMGLSPSRLPSGKEIGDTLLQLDRVKI